MASNTERYPADVFNTWMENVDWNWRFEIFKESEEFFFFFFFPLTALKNSRENGLNFPAVIWNDTFARRITIINKTARLDGKSYQLQWYVDRPIPVLWKTKVFHFFFFFFREYQKYQLDNSVLWNSKSKLNLAEKCLSHVAVDEKMKHGVDHVYDEKYDSDYRHVRLVLPVHGLEEGKIL